MSTHERCGSCDGLVIVGRDLPDVPECHGHKHPLDSCAQCNGGHRHEWDKVLIVHGDAVDVAIRCRVCGGRKCDVVGCFERRHHRSPHLLSNGKVRSVGS